MFVIPYVIGNLGSWSNDISILTEELSINKITKITSTKETIE